MLFIGFASGLTIGVSGLTTAGTLADKRLNCSFWSFCEHVSSRFVSHSQLIRQLQFGWQSQENICRIKSKLNMMSAPFGLFSIFAFYLDTTEGGIKVR